MILREVKKFCEGMTGGLELYGVHITGLYATTTEQDLRTCFCVAGKIKKVKILNKNGKTVAFINYYDEASQTRATRTLHETTLNGKKLNVTKLTQNPAELMDVYVSGHPQDASNEDLREMLEEICKVPCIRVTNKGPYCFYQVQGEKDYLAAMQALNGAITRTGHKLISQPSRRKTTYTKERTRLAEIINEIAHQNGILPAMEPTEMYLLERSIRTVHISSLPQSITEDHVKNAFAEHGEIEDVNIVCKAGYTTGYGFIVFCTHDSIQKFRKKSLKSLFINNCAVRVASSKPTKKIVDTALMAGLLDIDNNPTSLFFGLLESALQQLRQAGEAQVSPTQPPALMYLQDPTTGQIYAMTQAQYHQHLASQGITQEDQQKYIRSLQQQLTQSQPQIQPVQIAPVQQQIPQPRPVSPANTAPRVDNSQQPQFQNPAYSNPENFQRGFQPNLFGVPQQTMSQPPPSHSPPNFQQMFPSEKNNMQPRRPPPSHNGTPYCNYNAYLAPRQPFANLSNHLKQISQKHFAQKYVPY